ncbi:uncharacterized protein At1g65710-like [Andrographis paniculata]|uniref:uncharacterized protein At1g65710-like n=1 Tax=Andrographis paniculata TaxID=175694 RepID=UPI0021E8C020|nr:uncharacterized protein At1g65710-like [Andrographis paniculata]
MGCCSSKNKNKDFTIDPYNPQNKPHSEQQAAVKKEVSGAAVERQTPLEAEAGNRQAVVKVGSSDDTGTVPVCSTTQDIDAILLECGRLSRSNSSAGKNGESGSRRRSYDLDGETRRNAGEEEGFTRKGERRQSPRRRPERDKGQAAQPRSGSRERRRLSRSPNRHRSESPPVKNTRPSDSISRPGKIVAVPATVPSVGEVNATPRRKAPARRSGGGGASPRARSPARMSRSNSRNGERRNPLSEIDSNITSTGQGNKKPCEVARTRHGVVGDDDDAEPVLGNSNASPYAAFLLDDIRNFHQKNPVAAAAISLPPCVAKACSIVEAVADLNSGTNESGRRHFLVEQTSKIDRNLAKPDPILESGIIITNDDDLGQPSYHKYVTLPSSSSRSVNKQNGAKTAYQASRASGKGVGSAESKPEVVARCRLPLQLR